MVIIDVLAAAVKMELESVFSSGIFVVDEGRMACLGLGGVILAVSSTSQKFLRGTSLLLLWHFHPQPLGCF